MTKLTPTQRRQMALSIANSSNSSPAARIVADAAMGIIREKFEGMAEVLKAEAMEPDDSVAIYSYVIIMPVGERCNLRCKYCFNHPSDSTKIMSADVLEAIISQVLEMIPGNTHFSFHGGEPLLAGVDFFETAVSLQEKYSKPGQRIKNSVQTNGTLLNENWGRFFAKHGFNVGTSIDGMQETHDANRVDPAGRGTLSRVMEGIRAVQKCGVKVGAISVITCPPATSPQELLDFMTALGLHRWRINPCCDPDLSRCYGEYLETLFDIWVNSEQEIIFPEILDVLRGSLGYKPRTCRMSGGCSRIIGFMPDGSVKPCCERSMPEEIYFGNILEDSLVNILNSRSAQSFWNSRKTSDSYCDECEWWDMCYGGCTHNRIDSTGFPAVKDPMCEIYVDTFQRLTSCIDQVLTADFVGG